MKPVGAEDRELITKFRGAAGTAIFPFSVARGQPISLTSVVHSPYSIYRHYTMFSRYFRRIMQSPVQIPKSDKEHFITLNQQIVECQRCPRLIHVLPEVAVTKRRAYID